MTATSRKTNPREQALRSLGQLPPFPAILNRLIATLAREDSSFIEIAELIEKDTVVAGNVLKIVNSALYSRRATVTSVRHAVTLLGINKLRNAALGMSVTRMWNQVRVPGTWSMARFNLHSVATALLADSLAQRVQVDDSEGAFVAGLFHDVGRLLITIGLPDEYSLISRMNPRDATERARCELEVLGCTHAELSRDAVQAWKLTESVQRAVLFHHQPLPSSGATLSLSRLVDAANTYVNGIGISICPSDTPPGANDGDCLNSLGLAERLPTLLEDFNREFEAIHKMF